LLQPIDIAPSLIVQGVDWQNQRQCAGFGMPLPQEMQARPGVARSMAGSEVPVIEFGPVVQQPMIFKRAFLGTYKPHDLVDVAMSTDWRKTPQAHFVDRPSA
jgi:hypothetical protein